MNSTGTARRAATARERARAELTREIKEEAGRQLAGDGADGLSLRAVAPRARHGVVRAVPLLPDRDDLLTALIIDAYNALGAAAERAIAGAAQRGSAGSPPATPSATGHGRTRTSTR